MKIRYGFVTNSSSSSFIIGRGTEGSVEDVYQMVRNLYIEYYNKIKFAIDYVKTHENKGLAYSKERGIYIPREFKMSYKRRKEIMRNFQLCTGLDYYDIYGHNLDIPEWVPICKTYIEYKAYWEKDLEQRHCKGLTPFSIVDFLKPEITWVWGPGYTRIIDTSYSNETLNWYFECTYKYPGCTKDFSECPMKKERWFDMDESLCKRLQAAIGKGNICYEVLGRFCIYSECGYIPTWIVEKLSEVSEFSCEHMG